MAVTFIKKKYGPRAKMWYFVVEHYIYLEKKGWVSQRQWYGVAHEDLAQAWKLLLAYIKVSFYHDQYQNLLGIAHYAKLDKVAKIKMVN